jgi:hypothetical protein
MTYDDNGTAKKLTAVDDTIVTCRAWGHDWPSRKLRPGRRLPRGFVPRRQVDGTVLITETCNGCGKKRWYLTAPGGAFDRDSVRRYVDPPGWVVIHTDDDVSRRDFQHEVFRRVNEEITAAAGAAPEEEEEGNA